MLTGFDPTNKMALIKLYRELTGASLGDSKAAVEGSATKPITLKTSIPLAEATALKARIVAAGGKV